jgi:hypothetical protein
MLKRWSAVVLLILVVASAVAAGIWYHQSRCHGMDACAAAAAESHERDTPKDTQYVAGRTNEILDLCSPDRRPGC